MTTFDHEAFWSARYRDAGDDYLFGTAPNRFLADHAQVFVPGMSVLTIADGEGRNAVWMAEQGCAVTATEISPVALEKAARLARNRQVDVNFVLADVLNWEWPVANYDAVVGIFIQFVGPAERDRLIAGMQNATKPGGLLLLHGYTPEQLQHGTGGPSAVENLDTESLLENCFHDWEIVRLKAHESWIEEGNAHKGRSALIDLIARKPA